MFSTNIIMIIPIIIQKKSFTGSLEANPYRAKPSPK